MNNMNDGLYSAIGALDERCDANASEYDGVRRSIGSGGMWDDWSRMSFGPGGHTRAPYSPRTDMMVRPEYNAADYYYERPGEMPPRGIKGQMVMSMKAYERVPIVRHVMDMMTDFTTEGLRIVHRDKNKNNFLQRWREKVNFNHVSDRIAFMLYVIGTAPVRMLTGRVPVGTENDWNKSLAADDIKIQKEKYDSRIIPLGYTMLNPLVLEVIGGDIATFVGNPIYGLKISQKIKMDMQKLERLAMTSENLNDIFKRIPDNLKTAIKGGHNIVPLDQNKLRVLFYKRDDWRTWPVPLLACIFESLSQLEKLHLADSSALDGAISQIRLWKLGIYNPSHPAHSILPKGAAINKLRNILANMGQGVLDLVWGPELDFKESSSQVHQYLGPEKYAQVMAELHSGLGIPQALTGSAQKGGSNSGFTNNAVTMKTLVERLEYGRRVLVQFWNEQLTIIQKAMGWKYPAKVMFDRKVLADEAAEKKIIMDLWDREIISNETLLELSGRDPELEIIRVQREARRRKTNRLPEKASPYHNPQWEIDLKKIILQAGGVAPSEVGLELDERKEGEQPIIDKQAENDMKLADKNNQAKIAQQKNKPKLPGGRPKTSTDKTKRKPRKDKPKSIGEKHDFVNLFVWANAAQDELHTIISPVYLQHVNKKNLRGLNKKEFDEFETFKFSVFARFAPYAKINEDNVYNILRSDFPVDADLVIGKEVLLKHFENQNERKPSVEELRQIQSSAYALQYEYHDEVGEVE